MHEEEDAATEKETVEETAPESEKKEEQEPVISPLSSEMAPPRDYTKERDDRVIPVVRQLLFALASNMEMPMGFKAKQSEASTLKWMQTTYSSLVAPMLIESDLYISDVSYLFSLMMQPLTLMQDMTLASFKQNVEVAHGKAWGIDDIDDLTVKQVNDMLMKKTEEKPGDKEATATETQN